MRLFLWFREWRVRRRIRRAWRNTLKIAPPADFPGGQEIRTYCGKETYEKIRRGD